MLFNRIEEIRVLRGMSREALGDAIHKKPLTIWRYERGISHPTDEILHKIARALNVEKSLLLVAEPVDMPERRPKAPGLLIEIEEVPSA